MRRQLNSYRSARANWAKAGKPKRSETEIYDLLNNKCKPCEHYRKLTRNLGQCKLCSCALNLGEKLNKLVMATEGCADKSNPRFVANVVFDENDEPIANPEYQGGYQLQETKRQKRIRERNERVAIRAAAQEAADKEAEAKPQSKAQRKIERDARIRKRGEKRAKLGIVNEAVPVKPTNDPLVVMDRRANETDCLRDLWRLCPGFLVGGGPSVNELDLELLKDSRICSMGINNVTGHIEGLKAMVYGDPIEKFHGGIFLNPGIMKFSPTKRLRSQIRLKNDDGLFEWGTVRVGDCPNSWGFSRTSIMDPATFLTTKTAHWGGDYKGHKKHLNSSLLGLRLMHYLGVKTVFLLGWDFSMTETSGYAFGQQRTSGAARGNNRNYLVTNNFLTDLRPTLEVAGMTVLNCNPKSRLSAFDFIPYQEAVDYCLKLQYTWPLDLSGFYEKVGNDDREGE